MSTRVHTEGRPVDLLKVRIAPPVTTFTSPCYGSLIVKLTVEVPPKAAPETTAGGVTGVMGNGQSGSM